MSEQHTYQILKKSNGKVIIQLDESVMELLDQYLTPVQHKLREVPQSDQRQHNFQRRIVPFFMNQFMHWASQMGYKQVDGYLKTIHRRKTSKQQKFELGDLKKLFGNINPRTKHIQIETQQRWIEFLQGQAEICVLINNKIKDGQTKNGYVQAIESLKEQLNKEQPYDKFLSIIKKETTTIVAEDTESQSLMYQLFPMTECNTEQDEQLEYYNHCDNLGW